MPGVKLLIVEYMNELERGTWVRIREVCEAVGLDGPKQRRQVRLDLNNLVRNGWLKRHHINTRRKTDQPIALYARFRNRIPKDAIRGRKAEDE